LTAALVILKSIPAFPGLETWRGMSRLEELRY
jgi:hypothetical protein